MQASCTSSVIRVCVCVLGLCLDIQHHKNKATGEVVLGGMYLKAVWVRISTEGSCCV